jgi:low temperature requirement protein LtrA
MLTGSSTNYLRMRGHGHAAVTTVELFFDLIFVFAVTQLSHTLLEHFTLLGTLQVALLFAAVWWAWINTSWVTNWLDPQFNAVRLLLFVLMLAGLFLSMSIPKAFTTHGMAFALGFAATQLTRDGFMLWALRRHHRGNFRNFQRIFVWHAAALIFWIAGGLAEPQTRLILWLAALTIDTLGPSLFFHVPGLGRSTLADWDVEGGHLAERCGLFVIIALGESILITGATFAGLDWNAITGAAFAHAENPGRMGRLAYTYLHLPIVAGIIVCAVADELVLAHPSGHAEMKLLIAGIGGPAIYLIGNALFKHTIHGHLPLSHLVGLGLLTILATLAIVSAWLTPLAVCTAATASLIVVAIWETRSLTPRQIKNTGKP